MRLVINIDGTICSQTNSDYKKAKPNKSRIALLNELYDRGHTIVYYTARGMTQKDSLLSIRKAKLKFLTKRQLRSWGAKYHEIYMNKPSGDLYIDDKGLHADAFFKD